MASEKRTKKNTQPSPAGPGGPEETFEQIEAALEAAPGEIESPLSMEELEYFYNLLLERRREILGDVGYMKNEALHSNREDSAGSLSNMPIHMADVGTDNYEQEFMLGLMESERKMLREIDWALTKIKNGTYGVCEGTGEPIVRARLEAKPEARYSVEYARQIEKGAAQPRPIDVVWAEMNEQSGDNGEEE